MANAIILGFVGPNGSSPTVTDNNGNTWPGAATVSADGGSGNAVAYIFVEPNPNSGATIVTVAFPTAINPAGAFTVSEFGNILASSPVDVTTSNANVATSSLTCGSFSPTAGDLIWAFFAHNGGPYHGSPTLWTKGSGFTMLDGDIAWDGSTQGYPHASEYRIAPGGSINPGITTTGDISANLYNCVAVALKASGGTPFLVQHFSWPANTVGNGVTGKTFKIPIRNPVGGSGFVQSSGNVYINKIIHFTIDTPPASWKLQIPSVGDHFGLGVLVNGQSPGQVNITNAVDSDGNTWNIQQNLSTEPQILWKDNLTPNTDRTITLTITGTPQTTSWRFYDVSGAAQSAFDAAAFIDNVASSGTTVTGCPVLNVPTAGDLVIGTINIGNGPGLGVTSPSNALWDDCTYPPEEVDADQLENADGNCSGYNTASGNQSFNWTITDHGSSQTIKGSAIAFKVAPASAGAVGQPFGVVGFASNEW